jgi:hypothetical protein
MAIIIRQVTVQEYIWWDITHVQIERSLHSTGQTQPSLYYVLILDTDYFLARRNDPVEEFRSASEIHA